MDQPDPGSVVGADDFQRHGDYLLGGGRPIDGIPGNSGLGLHRDLWHHSISLPALSVLALFVAPDDQL